MIIRPGGTFTVKVQSPFCFFMNTFSSTSPKSIRARFGSGSGSSLSDSESGWFGIKEASEFNSTFVVKKKRFRSNLHNYLQKNFKQLTYWNLKFATRTGFIHNSCANFQTAQFLRDWLMRADISLFVYQKIISIH